MPYANINERRAKQRQQYQQKKIEYAKQDNNKPNYPVNYYNESNDKRNYGKCINKNDDENDDDSEETDSEADTDSETDDEDNEINDDELLTEYLVFLLNYRDTKMNKYEKAINRKFKLIKCKNLNTYKIELY
jgi:hypothetical protein